MNRNLLIVDDEYEILTWLEEMFRYDFKPETDVYTASSARKALELLDQVKFDVVLTDIKMPGMDGITLFQKIKENWPRCKTVFLTGYRNFDDMYQVVKHKDVRYILKSEDDAFIMQTVKEAFEELQNEIEQEALREKRQQDMEKVRLWMEKEFIGSLLKGDFSLTGKNELAKQAGEAGISLAMDRELLLFLVRIDVEGGQIDQQVEVYSLLERVNQIIRRNLPEDVGFHMCIVEEHWSLGMVQPKDLERQNMTRLFTVVCGAIEYSQTFFKRLGGRSFSVVIESTPIGYQEIPAMFFRMKQIMVGGLGREKDVIAHVETVNAQREQILPGKAMAKIPMLKTYLELHRRQEFFELLDEVGAELLRSRSRHDSHGIELYYSVSVLLLQFINENQLYEQIAFHVGLYKLTNVNEHLSWNEALQYLYDVSTAIFRLLGSHEKDLSERALERICGYIEEHLDQELSLTKLADIGGFNASYLSRLFKQVYDVTLTDFIYQKRMKSAALLLKSTNDKIQEIAEKSGYLSPHSFARAFRSFYGISPVEYREISRKERS